jgi:uncharacterized protein
MKRFLTTLVILTALLGSAGAVWAGDFDKGLKAYQSGDFATAMKEWTPLAEQGDASAQFNLGVMYSKGKGVTQDDAEAFAWMERSAKQKYGPALSELGLYFERGLGTEKNENLAFIMYRKSAIGDWPGGQKRLGNAFGRGLGTDSNDQLAYMWMFLAKENGYKKSDIDSEMKYAASRLSSEQIDQAKDWARDCKISRYKSCKLEP